MSNQPNTEPTYRVEIADLLESYNQYKADEQAAKAKADGVKAQIETLLVDCDLAHVAGYELARVQPGSTKSWDTSGLLCFCNTLRRTDNAETAEAIMAYFKQGERQGYFRIARIRERPTEG